MARRHTSGLVWKPQFRIAVMTGEGLNLVSETLLGKCVWRHVSLGYSLWGQQLPLASFDKVLLTPCQEIKNRNLVSGPEMSALFQVQE